MARALILDFDGSVSPLDGARVLALRDREEAVRFGCRMHVLRELAPLLDPAAPPPVEEVYARRNAAVLDAVARVNPRDAYSEAMRARAAKLLDLLHRDKRDEYLALANRYLGFP